VESAWHALQRASEASEENMRLRQAMADRFAAGKPTQSPADFQDRLPAEFKQASIAESENVVSEAVNCMGGGGGGS
jgi:hypothetical protein